MAVLDQVANEVVAGVAAKRHGEPVLLVGW
jgi:hypothetical protein